MHRPDQAKDLHKSETSSICMASGAADSAPAPGAGLHQSKGVCTLSQLHMSGTSRWHIFAQYTCSFFSKKELSRRHLPNAAVRWMLMVSIIMWTAIRVSDCPSCRWGSV